MAERGCFSQGTQQVGEGNKEEGSRGQKRDSKRMRKGGGA